VKIRNRRIIRLLAHFVALTNRLLFRTLRIHVVEAVPGISPFSPPGRERYLYCGWHDAILGMIFCGEHPCTSGLVSQHADGEYVAEAMDVLNIKAIRGSSHRGGAAALKQMLSAIEDWHVAITTDGPRGPRHQVKNGIIYLASQTGRAIIPVAFSGTSVWRPQGKWTDMVVPKPFSTVYVFGGEPFRVPQGLSKDQLATYREQLQQIMDDLNELADDVAAGRKPLPEPRRAAA